MRHGTLSISYQTCLTKDRACSQQNPPLTYTKAAIVVVNIASEKSPLSKLPLLIADTLVVSWCILQLQEVWIKGVWTCKYDRQKTCSQ